MKRRQITIGLLFLTLLGASSCKKQLDVPSTHLTVKDQMWKVKNDARSAVFATYGLMRAALADNNAWFVYGELRAGDFANTSDPDLKAVASNNLNATSTKLEGWKNWRRFYATIAQANLCVSKLPLVRQNDFRYTDDELKLDIANVRFIRALAYFYLARIWGDVPLITKLPEGEFQLEERMDAKQVLDYVTQELLSIQSDLPWQYNGQFPEQQGNYWGQNGNFWKGGVATKSATYDLLAHVAAWQGDYLDAVKYTGQVLDNKSSGGYDFVSTATLTSTQGGVFGGQANDIIFALSFNKDYQESSSTGHIEAWTLAEPYISRQVPDIYIPNDTILNIFNQQGDDRFSISDNGLAQGDYFTGFGNPVPLFSKIRELSVPGENPFQNYQSAIVIFRYEEVVLLRAEALLYLGRMEEAINLLNSVKGQRGLPDYVTSSGNLEDAILKERRRELLGEGWRWFDLIRFGKVAEYTQLTQQNIQEGALFWPVAKDILTGNARIQQNAYWAH